MDHTRFEDLKQGRLDRMTESERAEFEQRYAAESRKLTEAPPGQVGVVESGD